MTIENIIKMLKDPDVSRRSDAIDRLAGIATKTTERAKYRLAMKALKYSSIRDPDLKNRSRAETHMRNSGSRHSFRGQENIPSRSFSSPIIPVFLIFGVLAGLMVYFSWTRRMELRKDQLEKVKDAGVETILNPLGVPEVVPPELRKGINLKCRPVSGSVRRSHVKELTIQRSGGKEIDRTELYFDLEQKIVKVFPDGNYEVEYRTSKVYAPVPLTNLGYPDPGKVLRKRLSSNGVVEEISGDIYGIVPGMAFINRYRFPNAFLMVGQEWKTQVDEENIRSATTYRLSKVLQIGEKKFFYVTFESQTGIDTLSFSTTVEMNTIGEIYLDYQNRFPIFLKEVSLMNYKKPDSQIGLEIKIIRTETFSEAAVLLKGTGQ